MSYGLRFTVILLVILAAAVPILTFERPGADAVQRGFRGTGMYQNYNPRLVAADVPTNTVPEPIARVPDVGPRAGQVYQNVRVLNDLSVGQFTRLMVAITNWVSPQQGCTYCHVGNNFAAEDIYTKHVSRRMLQMVKHINENWQSHVQQTGVTCYTCHRGNPVPNNVWALDTGDQRTAGFAQVPSGQNLGARSVGYSSLPFDPFSPFLDQAAQIRVGGRTALPEGNLSSIKQAEWTYGLMMHFSTSLGVNCTYCHNSRHFADWEQSPPTRNSAWYGIRMLRDVNNEYIDTLQPVFPPSRLGPHGDPLKANCATCHQGAYKPLYGVSMLPDYPELRAVRLNTTQAAAR